MSGTVIVLGNLILPTTLWDSIIDKKTDIYL